MKETGAVSRRAEQICRDKGVETNPYFVALGDGNFDKVDFLHTQAQFFFAVRDFSRPMSVLAARIPTNKQRVEILRNVWEEHGEGSLSHSHRQTFIVLLARLGMDLGALEDTPMWPEVDQFNSTLSGICVLSDYRVGASMLGIIEYMFADISGWVAQGIIDNGWLDHKRMIHYRLHQTLDVRHSQDFFDVIEPDWETHSAEIERGLQLGASAFDTLYRGLYRARSRR
jgi:pyrroloquinoline-quinone synthase